MDRPSKYLASSSSSSPKYVCVYCFKYFFTKIDLKVHLGRCEKKRKIEQGLKHRANAKK